MEWLLENWLWVVIGIVFVVFHLFGHGGHGKQDDSNKHSGQRH